MSPYWSCAPGAEEGMESDDLLCSRNARLKKALVGRALWKINQPPSLKRKQASLMDHLQPRSTGAVGPTRVVSLEEGSKRKKKRAQWKRMGLLFLRVGWS